MKPQFAYENLDLSDIKGEAWEAIPGSEGYFLISNFGRVKRLEYVMQYKNGAIYTKPEKILKSTIIKSANKFKKDYSFYLAGAYTLHGIRNRFMISRMVYHCFVEPFDMGNQDIVIICTDCNGFNMVPSNLAMATLSDRSCRIVERGRMESPFIFFTEEQKKTQTAAIIKSLSKQVSQYSLKGKKIKTYSSIAAAAKATQIFATAIAPCASGKGLSAGGYVWRWGKEKTADVEDKKLARQTQHRLKYGQKVTQYDFEGNKIAQYPSLQDAAAATNANDNAIRLVLKGVYKSAKGYFWKKGYGKEKIDLSNYTWGSASIGATQSRKVKQFSAEGKLLHSFDSVKSAAASIGVTPSCIISVCKGNQKTSGGYLWKYK